MALGDLAPWGYYYYTAETEDYCAWEAGSYWGIAEFFQHNSISDKCRTKGGLWDITLISHADRLGGGSMDLQKYRGPDNVERRA